MLERYPGITQQELADCLKVSKATIAASLKRMEKVGFVQRAPDPQDTRRNRITITELGRKASHDCRQEVDHLRDTLFSQVTPRMKNCSLTCCAGCTRASTASGRRMKTRKGCGRGTTTRTRAGRRTGHVAASKFGKTSVIKRIYFNGNSPLKKELFLSLVALLRDWGV